MNANIIAKTDIAITRRRVCGKSEYACKLNNTPTHSANALCILLPNVEVDAPEAKSAR